MQFDIFKLFSLTTFGEGGGAGGAAGGDGAAGEGNATPGESGKASTAKSGSGTGTAGEDLSKVMYGKQEAEAEQPEAEPEPKPEPVPAKKLSFDEMLKSDEAYQREMQKRIDNAINRRFAKSKAAEEQMTQLTPALNLLATKYGVEAGDTKALINAINADSDLIDQQAMDAGMEPEAYREFKRMESEIAALKAEKADRERHEHMQQMYTQWRQQEAQAKAIFPDLSLDVEIQNQQFADMLSSGIDVLTAYKVAHMDEISQGLVRNAAADAQRETIAKIQNKTNRPREGAAGKTQAATVKADPRQFTAKDFEEILRRAQRGDIIRF